MKDLFYFLNFKILSNLILETNNALYISFQDDFDLEFPSDKAGESYIVVEDAIKSDLNEFTFTTWFKTTIGLHEYCLLTYIVNNVSHIALRFEAEDVGDSPLIQTFHAIKVQTEKNDT